MRPLQTDWARSIVDSTVTKAAMLQDGLKAACYLEINDFPKPCECAPGPQANYAH
jgi:hypothetical protein